MNRRGVRKRILFYGGFFGALGFGYWYQPVRIDLFPRAVPVPNPQVDPEQGAMFRKDARIAILTAHPDDCEYYAGALVAKLQKAGAHVELVVLTDGDKGFYPWVDAAANRKVRRTEQTAAAKAWGAAKVTFLGFPDGRLRENDDTVAAATEALQGARWVLSFDGEYPPRVAHGDHTTAGRIVERAARGAGATWLVRFATHAPNHTYDLTNFDDAQRTLLDFHQSQFSGEKEWKVWGTIFDTGVTDGERIGASYGLAVRAEKL